MKLLSNSPQPFFHSESMCEIIKYSLNNVILIIKCSLSNVILIFRRAEFRNLPTHMANLNDNLKSNDGGHRE